jgi:hypothetical protein
MLSALTSAESDIRRVVIIGADGVECLDVAQRNPRTRDCGGGHAAAPERAGFWRSRASTGRLGVQEAPAVGSWEVLAGHAPC